MFKMSELQNKVLDHYFRREDKNINQLLKYAKINTLVEFSVR